MSSAVAAVGRRRVRIDSRRARTAAAVALVVSVVIFAVLRTFVVPERYGDLVIYRLEGLQVLHGRNLYGFLPGVHGYRATYPPFAGIVFTTYAAFGLQLLKAIDFVLTLASLVWVCVASCRLVGVRHDLVLTYGLAFAAVLLWCEPVYMTFNYGQINLYLLALVLWDFTRPADSRWSGIGIGLAAAIKVTPAVFVVYLVLTRRWAFGFRAAGTFAVTLALSLLVSVRDTTNFWTDYLFDVRRVGRLENAVNQTVRGWLVRADHTEATRPTEMVLVVLVAVVGLTVAVLAYHRLGERWGLTACALTGLMVSPIAWSHHWVWCVPVIVLLWFEARAWAFVALLVFGSFAVWYVPHAGTELHLSPLQVAASGWYVVFGLVFLALTARRTWIAREAARA